MSDFPLQVTLQVTHNFCRGLVFYIGTVPFLSLLLTTIHLIALHFDILPAQLPTSSGNTSKCTRSQTGYPLEPGLYLLALLAACLQVFLWLAQASICTACELGPILSGAQGNVPRWCPQSNFRDSGDADLPNMLAQLATIKDTAAWFMIILSALLIECARRQWARARIAAVEQINIDPGLREYDWKNGVTVSGVNKTDAGAGAGTSAKANPYGGTFELDSVPNPRTKQLPQRPPSPTKAVTFAAPPSRQGTLNYGTRGYETRTYDNRPYDTRPVGGASGAGGGAGGYETNPFGSGGYDSKPSGTYDTRPTGGYETNGGSYETRTYGGSGGSQGIGTAGAYAASNKMEAGYGSQGFQGQPVRNQPVRTGLDVGMSYESRI